MPRGRKTKGEMEEAKECPECGKVMEKWDSWGVYYCKGCGTIYNPQESKSWAAHPEKS